MSTTIHARIAPHVERFLERARARLDLQALDAALRAIEAKVGMRLSPVLVKLRLLELWFAYAPGELETLCHQRTAFRRFIDAPAQGPIVDAWMYRELAPRLHAAAAEFDLLRIDVERQLAGHGIRVPACEARHTGGENECSIGAPAATTIVDAAELFALSTLAEYPSNDAHVGPHFELVDTGANEDYCHTPSHTQAIIVWPNGDTTAIDRPLAIGREASFSPFAAHMGSDRKVSRRHATLAPADGGIVLRDLGSTNGTYLGDTLIQSGDAVFLPADAVIRFGTGLAVKIVFFPAYSARPTAGKQASAATRESARTHMPTMRLERRVQLRVVTNDS